MALMPESWLNMPMVMARKMGRRYFQANSGSVFLSLSRCTELTISWSSLSGSSPPIFCSTWRASSTRFCVTSQRGLCGMPNSMTRKRTAGRAATPNCQRHSTAPRPWRAIYEIRQIGKQDADDDVDLKHADQAAADSCGGELRDVHRT